MSGALDEFFVRFTDLAERSVDDTGRPELVQSDRIIHKFMYVCVLAQATRAHWLAALGRLLRSTTAPQPRLSLQTCTLPCIRSFLALLFTWRHEQ